MEDLVTDVPLAFHFLFSRSHAEVITGKQEGESSSAAVSPGNPPPPLTCVSPVAAATPTGVYAWIGINFVLGRFDHARGE